MRQLHARAKVGLGGFVTKLAGFFVKVAAVFLVLKDYLVKPGGLYMNHPDRALRKKTAEYFVELVDFCADIGGNVMVVGSPKQRNVLPGVSFDEPTQWAAESFERAVREAEPRNVIICFEPLGPAETNFMNTAEAAIQFVQRIPSKAFQIILDVKAMSSEAKPIPQIIQESWPWFAHFHANEPNLKGQGFGNMDFHPSAATL